MSVSDFLEHCKHNSNNAMSFDSDIQRTKRLNEIARNPSIAQLRSISHSFIQVQVRKDRSNSDQPISDIIFFDRYGEVYTTTVKLVHKDGEGLGFNQKLLRYYNAIKEDWGILPIRIGIEYRGGRVIVQKYSPELRDVKSLLTR
jgi:hypothetical protein